jgi:osmotically inducible lipoprotein OsmB
MKKITLSLITVIVAASLLCSCTNKQMGTVGGAALGGAIGYGVTGGSGVGAAVGAVGGGLIGNAVTH